MGGCVRIEGFVPVADHTDPLDCMCQEGHGKIKVASARSYLKYAHIADFANTTDDAEGVQLFKLSFTYLRRRRGAAALTHLSRTNERAKA
jgi:hypothetical protein